VPALSFYEINIKTTLTNLKPFIDLFLSQRQSKSHLLPRC